MVYVFFNEISYYMEHAFLGSFQQIYKYVLITLLRPLEICKGFLHFTVTQLNLEAQLLFFSISVYRIKYSLFLQIPERIQNSIKHLRCIFVNTINDLKSLTRFLNSFVLDIWLGSKYASEVCFSHVFFNKVD